MPRTTGTVTMDDLMGVVPTNLRDRMMRAVRDARYGVLAPMLKKEDPSS